MSRFNALVIDTCLALCMVCLALAIAIAVAKYELGEGEPRLEERTTVRGTR